MHMVVVGGTGLIGSRVVNRLRDHGVEVRVASLRTGVDAYSGRGLAAALDGAQVVIDALNLNRPSYEYEQAADFFETTTRNVLSAGRYAGVQHHLALSVVGAPRIDSSYFRGKAVQERLLERHDTPSTVLRTTLLYEYVPKLIEHAATTHFVRLPPVRVQPVAADEVVEELCRLALGGPAAGSFEVAGPEVRHLDDLAREVLAASGDTRPIRPRRDRLLPGRPARAGLRGAAALVAPHRGDSGDLAGAQGPAHASIAPERGDDMTSDWIDVTATPSGPGCAECLADGGWWFHLRRCAACGHIGCCDSSPERHATAHFRATGHRVVQSYEPGEDWFWDYASDEQIDPEVVLAEPHSHPADQPAPGPRGAVPPDWRSRLGR